MPKCERNRDPEFRPQEARPGLPHWIARLILASVALAFIAFIVHGLRVAGGQLAANWATNPAETFEGGLLGIGATFGLLGIALAVAWALRHL